MHITGLCRGNGKGYVQVVVPENCPSDLIAYATTSNGQVLACSVYELGFPGEDKHASALRGMNISEEGRQVVVCVPLLDGTKLSVDVFAQNTVIGSFVFSPLWTKIRSRLTYRYKPELAARIRDIDRVLLHGQPYAFVLGIYPLNEKYKVCRFRIVVPNDSRIDYQVDIVDQDAKSVGCNLVILEDSEVTDRRDSNIMLRELTYSVTLDNAVATLCISARPTTAGRWGGCFVCLLPEQTNSFLTAGRDFERHASVESGYINWFTQNRANAADLLNQKVVIETWEEKPLVSIITPVFRPDADFLNSMIDSVLKQSYTNFELVLINASGDCPSVNKVLSQCIDSRVKIYNIDNLGIVGNTNFGISKARGDYLAFIDHDDIIEPDALYQYVSTIRQYPDADLLYCDEDHLKEGHYYWPTFKPAFNRDLLYAHNYITHMLMVSRWVLERIELSEEDVNGAQDYDLTLKSSEKARRICAIPHMLYHWREHENSTSQNLNSKPYAIRAGQIALQKHFDRSGIEVTVENRTEPCAYRVKYAYQPKVSIVIPTKDHIDLLSRCIQSVMDKTCYPNFEIICVENNSVEQETFEYYQKIEKQYDNVRIVTWPNSGFNYSSICNWGAQYATGDLLLFLNNDTEVISANWLSSMAGRFLRQEVGVCGAKLCNIDNLVQHGGVLVVPGGCDYLNSNLSRYAAGYMNSLRFPFDCAAVTGACQMVRKSYFERVGGFDEKLAVSFSDIDLCLKIGKEGYLTVFEPEAELYHRESSSRGRDDSNSDVLMRFEKERYLFYSKWSNVKRGQFLNINLNQYDGHFKIQS